MPRFYLTTAIDYVNNRPHLGTAYEKVAADVVARFKRLAGYDVHFVMGNDEHSQNVFRRAKEQGLEPLAYCDRMEQEFRAVWSRLNVSFDDFIRTTEPRHKKAVQALVQESFDRGDIYEGVYKGWYCVSCEEFKPEKTLLDGLCPVHRTKPDWIEEKNYFFRLSKYGPALLAHYDRHPEFVVPASRQNEMRRLIEGGLEDISVSRAGQAWGIPLPFDSKSVVYVWYDALINYAAAVGYGSDPTAFGKWWPADLHIVGKDITRFHCVVWPAMLMSAGVALPKQVFGHGWVLFKGEKMSKSLGTIVDPLEAADRLGPDPLRWYLTREIIFGQDGDFSWELFEKSYNADLANNLGNLVNRVTTMADRYRGGVLRGPGTGPAAGDSVQLEEPALYRTLMEKLDLSGGAAAAMRVVDRANEWIATQEPWKVAKAGDGSGVDRVLWNAAEMLRQAAVLLSPFMPASSSEILRRLGVPHNVSALRLERDTAWQANGERRLQQGPLLWPRLEPPAPVVEVSTKEQSVPEAPNTVAPAAQPAPAIVPANESAGTDATMIIKRFPPTAPDPAPAPPAEPAAPPQSQWPIENRITIDDFMKVDLRVARVLTAERVPNSKKLIKMSIDLGSEQRTIVAGIAEAYEADALVGRHVAIVANLKPAKLMGIESNGMVLAASPDGGKPMLIDFDQPPTPGTRVPMIDSHCHLADEAFAGDLEAVIARAQAAGVREAICILSADEPEEISRTERLVQLWPAVRFAAGVHPHRAGAYAGRPGDAAAAARDAATRTRAVAIGEIGLDYHYNFAPRDVQREVFAAQVGFAIDADKPVVIHTREATADTVAVLREAGQGRVRGVFHCFSGTLDEARLGLDLGFDISLSGILTFPKAEALREVARFVPADRLLMETDAPFLAPVPHRGKRNEPAWVMETLARIAAVRAVPADVMGQQIADNLARLMGPRA